MTLFIFLLDFGLFIGILVSDEMSELIICINVRIEYRMSEINGNKLIDQSIDIIYKQIPNKYFVNKR